MTRGKNDLPSAQNVLGLDSYVFFSPKSRPHIEFFYIFARPNENR